MNKKELLYRFFEITGNEKDSLIYLRTFRELNPLSFALIYCEPNCFSETGESLLFDLKLLQGLDLFPILMINESIPEYLNLFYGKILNTGEENNPQLLNLNFISYNDVRYLEKIQDSINRKKIPFLLHTNLDKDELSKTAGEIIKSLSSKKFIYLSPDRMFKDENGESVSLINFSILNNNKHSFNHNEYIFLENFKILLETYSESLKSISVTTPLSLFKELFTVKGSGTYFKLGSKINIVRFTDIDKNKLKNLLEISFRKKIKEDFLSSKLDNIILESNYRGAAILRNTEHGVLLSKFAVDEIARGEGIGREIWDRMKKEYSKIIWRANKFNPINKWYQKECDGMIKEKNWNVYWIGVTPNNIEKITDYLNNLPPDFYENDNP